MINNVTLVGRAGGDPDIKTFSNDNKLAELNMAIKRYVKGKEPATDWFQIKVWGDQANVVQQYIKKGHLFGVIGELQVESWEKNGEKRSKVVIHARRIQLMEPKKDEEETSEPEQSADDVFGESEPPADPWG
jgi:single-strand DNA-binding protein